MENVAINGKARTEFGKKGSKAMRREGYVPSVLYGGEEVIHFGVTPRSVKELVYTPDFKVAQVSVDGKTYSAILKDIQFHPLSDELLHLDFLELVPEKQVKVAVPVKFVGAAPGLKVGGKLMQALRRIKIKTTPEHLVDTLELDISKLELGQSIRVRDIKTPEGIEITSAPGTPVASIEVPRALRSAAAAEEKETIAAAE